MAKNIEVISNTNVENNVNKNNNIKGINLLENTLGNFFLQANPNNDMSINFLYNKRLFNLLGNSITLNDINE